MTKQPEALRLADALDAGDSFYYESSLSWNSELSDAVSDAADELRRLHVENEMQLQSLKAARILLESAYQLTKKDEALMRQALEALENSRSLEPVDVDWVKGKHKATIAALRERLGEKA